MSGESVKANRRSGGNKLVPRYIRRSLLFLSMDDAKLREKAFDAWADAVVLDFVKAPGRDWQQELRTRMPAAIYAAQAGGAEVFVRIDGAALAAELGCAVFAGLRGVILQGIETAAQVNSASEHLSRLEAQRGVASGSLEIDVEINTPAGVWNALEIARASDRFGAFALDERRLSHALGMSCEPQGAFEPLEYIKSQLITVATSVGGQAYGMSYPLSLTQQDADEHGLRKAVRRARDTGFKGAICPHASWVRACNEGFRPSAEEAAYYAKVRELFAEGLKRGMASVPLDGKMIDVPVDVRARVFLEWANRAHARDQEKAKAHESRADV